MPQNPKPYGKKDHSGHHPYTKLLVMSGLSFFSMFGLMYSMVDSTANIYLSLNQVYMSGLMTGAMVLIELGVMRAMYPSRTLNMVGALAASIALLACFAAIKAQSAITDKQFLRSMISHHAGALLMCDKASLEDQEIKNLCQSILAGQRKEIEQMKARLAELNTKQ
ncbi:MAG: DUF305 domain-containing protein [Bdellovibrionales bacterium]|nr:DUF305 domain-containing protein [Bdellovibrionales bacterium]